MCQCRVQCLRPAAARHREQKLHQSSHIMHTYSVVYSGGASHRHAKPSQASTGKRGFWIGWPALNYWGGHLASTGKSRLGWSLLYPAHRNPAESKAPVDGGWPSSSQVLNPHHPTSSGVRAVQWFTRHVHTCGGCDFVTVPGVTYMQGMCNSSAVYGSHIDPISFADCIAGEKRMEEENKHAMHACMHARTHAP